MNNGNNITLKEKVINNYKEFENSLNGMARDENGKIEKIHSIRLDALKRFEELGFPEKKLEDWKYTNIHPIIEKNYSQKARDIAIKVAKKNISDFLFPGLETNLLVFINGIFSKKLSNIENGNDVLFIGSLSGAYKIHKELIDIHFSKYARYENEGLTALNTAYAYDGAFVYLPKGKILEKPIHIIFISDSKTTDIMSHPRNLIIAGENSKATVIESYHSFNHHFSFSNVVTEIVTEKESEIEHYKIQDESPKSYDINTTYVMQEKDSRFHSVTISWGGDIVRNNLNVILNGENSECLLYGLYAANESELIDNHTFVDHSVPNCRSNELYKGIMDDVSTGVFNGKIIVRVDAQKTNAYQSNKIFADDVKCSHGATTGQLDKDEIFYLMARGIGKQEAQRMLLIAFANDIIENIKIEAIRKKLYRLLVKKLSREK